MEDTEPMDVDESPPQGAKEDPNVCNATNRKFVESVQHCTITLEKKDADAALRPINAVLNSGGGIVLLKIDDFSRYKKGDLNKRIDIFWQTLEQKLNPMIQPSTYDDVFDKKLEGDTILLFIKATNHLCTVDYNMHLPFDAASLSRPTYEKVVDLLSRRESLENHIPEVPLTDLPIDLLPKQFTYKEVLDFHESKQVQLKYFTSKNGLFHPNNQRAQDKIAEHISSFGNGSGGMILIGIEDKTGETLGQEITADGKAEWESGFQAMINRMSETSWSFTPKKGEHWGMEFFPVDGTKSRCVIVVRIAGMRNLGGIFTKCPKSFELRNPSGSDGEEQIVPLEFHEWNQRMLCSTRPGQSKVGSGCPVVPNGFESNLPKEAKRVIKKIQKQIANGLLVASPSMLSAVQKEEHRKEDGVICDLLLLSESLGRLHLISLVSSESQDQFFSHARATAKAVKKSLVRNGGCYEKFYITCQVVLCRVGTEPLEIPFPDSRYPKEYDLGSSTQELVKINKILQSLVTVLAQFPSFLSNKQGLKFLNLLTKEQFELLHEEIDEHKELWIQGPAGTGKTVVAIEFIRRLLRRDPNLKPENILYVCERPAMLPQIRKLNICECRTLKAFKVESFPEIRHVILDEVQLFQAKDEDWLGKARTLVRQTKYRNDPPGYLWCFMDKAQNISNTLQTGIPHPLPQTFFLRKVIRNSKRIFELAEKCVDKRIWRTEDWKATRLAERRNQQPQDRPEPFTKSEVQATRYSRERSVTIGHDFDGEENKVEYSNGERIACLIRVLESLLTEGYSKRDIAVLCLTVPLEGNELKQLQEFTLTVNAERNDGDNIVLSTAREYGGLERPVVVIVAEPEDNSSKDMFPNRVKYCAITRGMVKVITLSLKKNSRGQKRKESN